MKFTLPQNAFPDVELSHQQQDALAEEADSVVKEIVAANDAFLADGATFRDSQWSHIRAKDGLHVFRQRSCGSSKTQGGSWSSGGSSSSGERGPIANRETSLSSSSAFGENSIMERMKPAGVSLMALHGIVDGNLDDCMFGCFASTDEAWKLRSSHINDRLDDARILATIRGPTQRDPFRFLGIKWFAKEHPVVLSTIVQQRDFLIMEASGLTLDSKGQRVGYFLMHSVTLRAIPELTEMGIVRGKMSFCYIFRQGGPGKVQVYTLGYFDSRGDMPGRVSVAIAAEAAICCGGVVDYAYIKKLAWLMGRKGDRSGRTETASRSCESCHKSLTKFSLSSSGSGGACRICRRATCGKCSVVKKMTVDVSDTGSVQQCSFRFCLVCLFEAKKQSAWDMALSSLDRASNTLPPATPQSLFPPIRTPLNGRGGRSYSEYQHADTRAYQRSNLSRSGPVLASRDARATQRPPVTDARFQAWSSLPSEASREPKSLRGVRLRTEN
ncbi:hypothetical protein PRIC1_004480 [Phytophthora ramorum]|uniref:uncharacterized protein n=1 Tax=Phytophthora ramorum TaxID=164328 RepID=UPI00309F0987|nr:hypothetical protein KRP23_4237 [Phytophthora ramorum]